MENLKNVILNYITAALNDQMFIVVVVRLKSINKFLAMPPVNVNLENPKNLHSRYIILRFFNIPFVVVVLRPKSNNVCAKKLTIDE